MSRTTTDRLVFREPIGRGVFVVFDGIDGSGKSSLVAATTEYLTRIGYAVVSTRSPPRKALQRPLYLKYLCDPATRHGIDYRGLIATLMGARLQHAHEVIVPALERGAAVVCDRYVFSAAAHFLARGLPRETWFLELCRHLPGPTVAFHATAPVEVTMTRVRDRSGSAASFVEVEFYHRLHSAYLRVSKSNRLIDVQTSAPVEETFLQVRRALERSSRRSERRLS